MSEQVNGTDPSMLATLRQLIAEDAVAMRTNGTPRVTVDVIGNARLPQNGRSAGEHQRFPENGDGLPDERRRDRGQQPVDCEDVDADGRVVAAVDHVRVVPADRELDGFEQFPPFPIDALPEPIRRFVNSGAKAIGCDRTYLALPMLSALAGAIGNTRQLQLKRGRCVPAIVWSAIVGASGTAKTSALKLVMEPFHARQDRAWNRHAAALHRYAVDVTSYRNAYVRWQRNSQRGGPAPVKPERPRAERSIVTHTTADALASLLLENPRGLLLASDQLAVWMSLFEGHAGRQGSVEAAHWLAMHDANRLIIDRKSGRPRSILVSRAAVSVAGGVQPASLQRALASGLAARLLVSWPPERSKPWTEASLDCRVEAEVGRLVDRLYELQPARDGVSGPRPVVVGLTAGAKTAWKAYYNDHAKEQARLVGDMRAAFSKLREYAARLALVVHCVRHAAGDEQLRDPNTVDAASMQAGIRLANWCKAEAQRVYKLLCTCDLDRSQNRLIDWIGCKGGWVTVRDVQQGHRRYKTADEAETALEELVRAGRGHWEESPVGRRGPKRWFILSTLRP